MTLGKGRVDFGFELFVFFDSFVSCVLYMASRAIDTCCIVFLPLSLNSPF